MRAFTRRSLLAGGSAALIFSSIVPPRASAGNLAWLACAKTTGGGYQAIGLNRDGRVNFAVDLPGRGHGVAVSTEGSLAVVFARRPGRFALVIDIARGEPTQIFETPEGRHFSGHGFFAAGGTLLYSTENDFEREQGVLGIYDACRSFRRIGELESHGVGPHEAILLSDGCTVAVANGGILTHPEFSRAKLNIDDMEPSLAFINAIDGRLLARAEPPPAWHKLSIRHLAEDSAGRVWLGCQYEGNASDAVPLIGRTMLGRDIDWLELDTGTYRGMRQYIGSLASFDNNRRIAFTSPVGGRLAACDVASGAVQIEVACPDICGLAPAGAEFLSADGAGNLWRGETSLARHPWLAWDNHITVVPEHV